MNRVLCGDVGFGKTEVAMRSAFVAINSDKQVVLLCPSTVLSEQHYESFLERFKNTGRIYKTN
jgi:transcription-repair coupling factor (superfamily II helicase)